MEIIAHRGMWNKENEKNTLWAFNMAFVNDFGVELDVRDRNGELVIAHNMPDHNAITLEFVFSLYKALRCTATLAINVKADGLAEKMKMLLDQYHIENYFTFDMSSAELFSYATAGIKTYARFSSWESVPPWPVNGLWVDSLHERMDVALLDKAIATSLPVCIVSEELHGRDATEQWHWLKKYKDAHNLRICSDNVTKAKEWFE